MWGNRLGWGISAGIVIVVVGALMILSLAGSRTPPTDFSNQQNLAAVQLPIAPDQVFPMTDPTDAGPLYRQAISDYLARPSKYLVYLGDNTATSDDANKLAAVGLLRQAATCSKADVFQSHPEQIVNYTAKPELNALGKLGDVMLHAGLLAKVNKQNDLATSDYEAAFALGAKLYAERLTHDEYAAAVNLMGGASQAMVGLYADDPAKANAWANFNVARRKYDEEHIDPIWKVLGAIGLDSAEEHAGDVFVFAQSAQDRMWRVEGVLKMGRLKYEGARKADQRDALVVATQMANSDPDTVVRLAAAAARELTPEIFRQLSSDSN